MSIDGFIAGTNGEMDWLEWNWDDHLKNYVRQITETVDCIVLGRKLAEGFIPYWATHPEEEGADTINRLAKIVFTKTMEQTDRKNTTLSKVDIVEEITHLKKQDGKDIIVFGGADFISALIKHRLIDEFYFLVNPTLLGKGRTIFKDLTLMNLKFKQAIGFECGISVLNYEIKQA